MGENSIQSIGSGDSESRGTIMYQMFQNQLYKTSDSSAASTVQPEKAEIPARSEKADEKQAQQSLLPITNNDTFLRFMVDKKTNDITVYVVDRASHRVMRSIPPTDVNNLKAGDLLKLLV
jgi:uncharacterized FlaG/YvyC family protein